MPRPITNFGANLHFTPRQVYAPRTDAEVLAILEKHAHGKIRVVGARHSWSPAIVCNDAIVDLRHFNNVHVERTADGVVWATVGGGCRIKRLLHRLRVLEDVTMPSVGLITAQTIAGAIATATHGSGKHSLAHYIEELRVAAYDPVTGKPRIYCFSEGDGLRAARCAVGCMGIVLSVRFRCVARYDVAEAMVPCTRLDDVLAEEPAFPLQQFYLVPHRWTYFAQRRSIEPAPRRRRGWRARLYRAYWLLGIDIGLHLVIKLVVCVMQRPAATCFFYRHVLPRLILTNTTVVDCSERMLVMRHDLFKHLEIEIFVPAAHLAQAAALVRVVIDMFAGTIANPDPVTAATLQRIGLYQELLQQHGTFTHHYPITFRRVLPDDTLISMTTGDEVYYAISFITYHEPRDRFLAMADCLARVMTCLFDARLHWGKYFPLDGADVARMYPLLAKFREICCQVDPRGVFRNTFAERSLFDVRSMACQG
jgi:FAD/FMN-containing dehydrogenase